MSATLHDCKYNLGGATIYPCTINPRQYWSLSPWILVMIYHGHDWSPCNEMLLTSLDTCTIWTTYTNQSLSKWAIVKVINCANLQKGSIFTGINFANLQKGSIVTVINFANLQKESIFTGINCPNLQKGSIVMGINCANLHINRQGDQVCKYS